AYYRASPGAHQGEFGTVRPPAPGPAPRRPLPFRPAAPYLDPRRHHLPLPPANPGGQHRLRPLGPPQPPRLHRVRLLQGPRPPALRLLPRPAERGHRPLLYRRAAAAPRALARPRRLFLRRLQLLHARYPRAASRVRPTRRPGPWL